jgi:hypothetical protein
MSQEEDNSKEILEDNSTKLGQLVRSILQTVDELFPSKPEFSVENIVAQFYTQKVKSRK